MQDNLLKQSIKRQRYLSLSFYRIITKNKDKRWELRLEICHQRRSYRIWPILLFADNNKIYREIMVIHDYDILLKNIYDVKSWA